MNASFAWSASKIQLATWLTAGIVQLHSDTALELNQMKVKMIWLPVATLTHPHLFEDTYNTVTAIVYCSSEK